MGGLTLPIRCSPGGRVESGRCRQTADREHRFLLDHAWYVRVHGLRMARLYKHLRLAGELQFYVDSTSH
eukprot:COSAG06_NODE_3684_length_5015_cov_4.312246_6_plen_69_part_00